jgi:hypothetical protein
MQKVRMNKTALFISVVFCWGYFSCKQKPSKNVYENNFGIPPAVLAQLDSIHYTQIQWIDSVKTIGNVFYGDTVLLNFMFKNTGETPLFIAEVKPSCGCTVANYPKHGIMPGEIGILQAKYTSEGFPGNFRKSITVKSNTTNGLYHSFQFSGILSKDSLPHQNKTYLK